MKEKHSIMSTDTEKAFGKQLILKEIMKCFSKWE